MEYIAYSLMVIANQEATGQADYAEYNLPKFQVKLLKSSAWLSLAGITVFLAALTQAQTASAAYINTNGSCLTVRTGPSINSPSVNCLPNGTQITTRGSVNGFYRLSQYRYVAARWVSGAYNPNPGTGTGAVGNRIILSLGFRGPAVSQVQRALGIQATGYYGSATASRVRNFQARNGLIQDGVVGPQTRNALFRGGQQPDVGGPITLSFGSRGSTVSQLQRALGIEPTGYYGSVTASRVRDFQARNGLRADGVFGPETRNALFRS